MAKHTENSFTLKSLDEGLIQERKVFEDLFNESERRNRTLGVRLMRVADDLHALRRIMPGGYPLVFGNSDNKRHSGQYEAEGLQMLGKKTEDQLPWGDKDDVSLSFGDLWLTTVKGRKCLVI
ncbi:hypothetical protein RB195_005825 [Necator americanus]|uniref:Uncharacterized protein n=1 Tax=Necator americanus TaxID=51031 RepID=A0ABR1BPS1_NECAM